MPELHFRVQSGTKPGIVRGSQFQDRASFQQFGWGW
jgi:hypothetical protein